MNCPWFLKPSDALSSVIVLPVSGSMGSMPPILVLRFGFDSIFAAIGFSVVADPAGTGLDVGPSCVDDDFACVVVGLDADPVFAGLPVLCVVVAGLPVVVGFPALAGLTTVVGLTFIDLAPVVGLPALAGLPTVVGLPALCGFVVVGFAVVVGLTAFGDLSADALTTAGESVRDTAATQPSSVAESRMRRPPGESRAS